MNAEQLLPWLRSDKEVRINVPVPDHTTTQATKTLKVYEFVGYGILVVAALVAAWLVTKVLK